MSDKKFDKIKYNAEYNQQHYIRITYSAKPETAALINTYSNDIGMSRTKFITECIMYCIENGVFMDNAQDIE